MYRETKQRSHRLEIESERKTGNSSPCNTTANAHARRSLTSAATNVDEWDALTPNRFPRRAGNAVQSAEEKAEGIGSQSTNRINPLVSAGEDQAQSIRNMGAFSSSIQTASCRPSVNAYHWPEVKAPNSFPQARGYIHSEFEAEKDWRTGKPLNSSYDKMIDETLFRILRCILLMVLWIIVLVALLAVKLSLFAIGDQYHRIGMRHDIPPRMKMDELCKLRAASQWALLGPFFFQLLFVFVMWRCTQSPHRQERLAGINTQNWARDHLDPNVNHYGMGYSKKTMMQKYGVMVVDGVISAMGNLFLQLWILPGQSWAWVSLGMLLVPFFSNLTGTVFRLFFSPKHKRPKSKKRIVREVGDVFSTSCQFAAIVWAVVAADHEATTDNRYLLIPLTLFGGLSILATRWRDNRSPRAVQNAITLGSRKRSRYRKATLKLAVEVLIMTLVSTYANQAPPFWGEETGVGCSPSNMWKVPSLASDSYMTLAIIHILSSVIAVHAVKFACSIKMNLLGLVLPLFLFWPVLLVIARLAEDSLPHPLVWGARESNLLIPIAGPIPLAYVSYLWKMKDVCFEESTAVCPGWEIWYQPFFNPLVLEQSILYNRGDKEPSEKKEEKRRAEQGDTTEVHRNPVVEYRSAEPNQNEYSRDRGSSGIETETVPTNYRTLPSDPREAERVSKIASSSLTVQRPSHKIIMATCMWHEAPHEMEQWISSLGRIVKNVMFSASRLYISSTGVYSRDTYEAHIVFDSAFDKRTLNDHERRPNVYAESLLNKIETCLQPIIAEAVEELKEKYDDCSRARNTIIAESFNDMPETSNEICSTLIKSQKLTEYGIRLHVNLVPKDARRLIENIVARNINKNKEGHTIQPELQKSLKRLSLDFYIHLKDPLLTYNGKRRNQLLYMNYLLGDIEEAGDDSTQDMSKTLLLTTDGDTLFEFKDVDALVDSLVRDREAAGSCGRIIPIGVGYMTPYQKFEYASGHWFQKAAEDVLGTVQCCPGCFSIWRVDRIQDILQHYSSTSLTGADFLRKDQGEDRWMCSLMIRRGWWLRYCAAAEAYTFAPEDLDTFFEQRRRWITSTLANMWDLVLVGRFVESSYGRNGMPLLYRVYVFVFFVLGLFMPATVIVLTLGGLRLQNEHDVAGPLVAVALPLLFVALVAWQQVRAGNPHITLASLIGCSRGEPDATEVPRGTFKRQQLLLAKILTVVYMALMVAVCVGLIRNALLLVSSASSIFFLVLVAVFCMTLILHPRDIKLAPYGLVYFLLVPMGYLVLFMYALANMNLRSWGIRGGEPDTNSNTAYRLVEDPIATDVLLRKTISEAAENGKDPRLKPEDLNNIMAQSLTNYFQFFCRSGCAHQNVDDLQMEIGLAESPWNDRAVQKVRQLAMQITDTLDQIAKDEKASVTARVKEQIQGYKTTLDKLSRKYEEWTHTNLAPKVVVAKLRNFLQEVQCMVQDPSALASQSLETVPGQITSKCADLKTWMKDRTNWREGEENDAEILFENVLPVDAKVQSNGAQDRSKVQNYDIAVRDFRQAMELYRNEGRQQCLVFLPQRSRGIYEARYMSPSEVSNKILSGNIRPAVLHVFAMNYECLLNEVFKVRRAILGRHMGYGQNIKDFVSIPYEANKCQDYSALDEQYIKTLDDVHGGEAKNPIRRFKKQNAAVKPSRNDDVISREIDDSLNDIRNNVGIGLLLMNGFFLVLILIVDIVPSIHVFGSNTAGFIFLIVCAIVMLIQSLTMLLHRWETFKILVSLPLKSERWLYSKTVRFNAEKGYVE